MKPDGYIPPSRAGDADTVIQYHGSYFHGYPPWHPRHMSHVVGSRWGPDLFHSTWEKMERYHEAGYIVLYVWCFENKDAVRSGNIGVAKAVHIFPERVNSM